MATVYSCLHCRTQNFATRARLRRAHEVPLKCWKCGKEIKKSFSRKCLGKKGGGT